MEILAFILSCVNLVLVIVAILKYKKLKDFVIADTVSRNEWNSVSDRITVINGRLSSLYDKYKEVYDIKSINDAVFSNISREFKNVNSKLDSVNNKLTTIDRDYNKALTGINDLYSAVDSIQLRMAGTIDANDKLGQENKNLEASTEEPKDTNDPFKSVVNTNLGPFGPREWPRDIVVGMDVGALNNDSDNENSDEPRDRVVNVINNINTSPIFWSKEEINKDKTITAENAIDGTTVGVEEVPTSSEDNNG